MRKTYPHVVVIVSLLVVVIGIFATVRFVRGGSNASRQAASYPSSNSVFTVLQAHRGSHYDEWPSFSQKGTMVLYQDPTVGSPRLFERKVTLSIDRSVARYDKATLTGRNQSFLFDGHTMVRTAFQADTELDVRALNGIESASVRFQITTFGLLPILRRISDPGTEVTYAGATEKGDRFQVNTAGGSWYFYSNSNHLIDQLEVGKLNIRYGDYRTVGGLILPFYQSVKKGDKLLYEIRIETIDLNPGFPASFFKSKLS